MKKPIILFLLIFSLSVSSFGADAGGTVQVHVNGLVCDFCARALDKVFSKQEAVDDIDVNLDTRIITIHLKEGQNLEDEKITSLVEDSGYNVREIKRDE